MSLRSTARTAALALVVASLIGCAAPAATSQVVTFEVAGGDKFKVLVTDPNDLATITALANSEDAPSIPNGLIVHETGVNTGWSWSLDPTDFAFVDVTDETCDSTPSDIEAGTFEGDRYCPWSAIVVAKEPAP